MRCRQLINNPINKSPPGKQRPEGNNHKKDVHDHDRWRFDGYLTSRRDNLDLRIKVISETPVTATKGQAMLRLPCPLFYFKYSTIFPTSISILSAFLKLRI